MFQREKNCCWADNQFGGLELLHMVSILVGKNQTKTRSDFWGVKLGLRRKTLYNKKAGMGTHPTTSTRQIEAQKHKSRKHIIIRTPLVH